MKIRVTTLITDLDNTLFDWVEIWYRTFSAQVATVARETGVAVPTLLREFRTAHQRYGTSEFAFSVSQLPSLLNAGVNVDAVIEHAWTALDEARRSAMRLYPNVRSTLRRIKRAGCRVIGYTESLPLYTKLRLVQLNLDTLIDVLYTPPEHPIPENVHAEQVLRWTSAGHLAKTVHRVTPAGEHKPNPRLLLDILDGVGGKRAQTIYVGDSQQKDVAMAQHAGVADVWAKYGVAQHREQYELLRAVTHWSDEAVADERTFELLRPPTYVLESGFAELFDFFDFAAL